MLSNKILEKTIFVFLLLCFEYSISWSGIRQRWAKMLNYAQVICFETFVVEGGGECVYGFFFLSSTVLVHASQIWTSGVWNNRIIALLEVVGVLLIFWSSVLLFLEQCISLDYLDVEITNCADLYYFFFFFFRLHIKLWDVILNQNMGLMKSMI
jgi:hypothetical protein